MGGYCRQLLGIANLVIGETQITSGFVRSVSVEHLVTVGLCQIVIGNRRQCLPDATITQTSPGSLQSPSITGYFFSQRTRPAKRRVGLAVRAKPKALVVRRIRKNKSSSESLE